jgi:uncharacterized protein (DUF1778 family)
MLHHVEDECNDNSVTFCYAELSGIDGSGNFRWIRRTKMATATNAPRQAPRKVKDTREPLNMRVLPETRSLIDRAAELTGKNRTDFVIDAARQAAQNALLDRTVIPINKKAHAAFVALLDAPPQPNERLRKSLQTPAPWDK